MIQRKQTIWLFIVALLALFTIKYPFYTGNIQDAVSNLKTFKAINAQSSLIILIITIAIATAALIAIFLYKDRKKQLLLTSSILMAQMLNVFLYYKQINPFVDGAYSITAIATFIIPIFILLASFGIYKDEQLVKSAERLR